MSVVKRQIAILEILTMSQPLLASLPRLIGTMQVPGDKSISHRSLMLSALCPSRHGGHHRVKGLLESEDVLATMRCLEQLGVRFKRQPLTQGNAQGAGDWLIESPERWHEPHDILDAQNSGTTMRLMSGLLAPQGFLSILTGDDSLKRRPMGRVVCPLRQMGAELLGRSRLGSSGIAGGPDALYAPLVIAAPKGRLQGISYTMPHASAQLKSAILLASLYAEGETVLQQPSPSRDHTERMLQGLGVDIEVQGNTVTMPCGQIDRLRDPDLSASHGLAWQVPGDPSSAAFFAVAAALLPGSQVRIEGVGLNLGRIGLVTALRAVGVSIVFENMRDIQGEPVGDWVVTYTPLKGDIILNAADIPALIDEVPIFAGAAPWC